MEKENKKTTEIPFGAKDSVLNKFEYTIPEGYEAEIKDGKVIIKKKESEDEKIRKAIIRLLQNGGYMEPQDKEKAFAWLEKQKEQKSAEWSEEDNSIIDALACYIENWRLFAADKNYKRTMWTSDSDEVEKYLIVLNKIKHLHPQQRKEWSEENDTAIHLACEFIRHHSRKGDSIGGIDCVELVKMLKSLRYQSISKPSEEQMMALQTAVADSLGRDYHNQLSLLEFDLRKRM